MTDAKRSVFKMKRFWALIIIAATYAALNSCAGTRALMQTAPTAPKQSPASPALAFDNLNAWEDGGRDAALTALKNEVYGQMPTSAAADISKSRPVSENAFSGLGKVEEFSLTMMAGDFTATGQIVLVTPNDIAGPVPVIVMQNFCPSSAVIPIEGITPPPPGSFDCSGNGIMASTFGYFFGQYIVTPPAEDILRRGYAIAAMHPPQWVPDRTETGIEALNRMNPQSRPGAILAWAELNRLAAEAISQDPRISKIIAYGHSRYGKSALLAAAISSDIDGVIAHQSGTGGASLNRDKPGETVAAITEGYPHWFNKNYAGFAGRETSMTSDQHFLLAAIAPSPILLGNAKRDVWSDPEGAFRAAQGADPVYRLYGKDGLTASKLTQFKPEDDIAFWMRPGTHGVTTQDWPAFLDFLDAHFK